MKMQPMWHIEQRNDDGDWVPAGVVDDCETEQQAVDLMLKLAADDPTALFRVAPGRSETDG